jgi:deoxyribodipyrimidine photo-lyase
MNFNPEGIKTSKLESTRLIRWEENKEWIERFRNARTGFPMVDAAVQELLQTGYVHNRSRMLLASFFTKDMLCDWRIGESFFMEHLFDGDIASNNGGWQWASSVTHDRPNYLRVFNPWVQSKKFDTDGVYIKTYVKELRDMDSMNLHEPINNHSSYPSPMLDHSKQKKRAEKMYGF